MNTFHPGMLSSRILSRSFFASAVNFQAKLTDVLIVGGGPAGLTLAAAIKQSPQLSDLSTVLVDAGDLKEKIGGFYHDPPDNFTNRVISLTPQSKHFLENTVGVSLMEERIQPFDGLYVTDGCSNGTLEMERDSMGSMVEILNIQSSLLAKLRSSNAPNLDLIDKTKVQSIEHEDPEDTKSWPVVTLDNGEQYKTRLLIGADGFNSPVRKFSGIESRGWFYERFGVVATLKLEYPPFKIRGWQRFLPTGPVAHLPLPGTNSTLVWSTTEPLSRLLLSLDDDVFVALVNAAFILEDVDLEYYYKSLQEGTITGEELIQDVDFRINEKFNSFKDDSVIDEKYPPKVIDILDKSRGRFPLKLSHADTYVAERIALVGDAAHTTHPLAGQGLNMGQGDVESLIKALEKARQRGLDIGSLLALEPYWADRYPTNNMLLGVVDKLHKLYSTDFGPLVSLRTFGLNLVNSLQPLKDLMVGKVSGPSK